MLQHPHRLLLRIIEHLFLLHRFQEFLILPMNNQPGKIIPDFLSTLETDYFIQLSVNALERMYERGTICESFHSEEAVKQMRNDSDSVEAWISEEMRRDPDERREKKYLYGHYENYCFRNDRTAVKKQTFYRTMRVKGFIEAKIKGTRYFKGISEKETAPRGGKSDEDISIPF